MIEAIKEVLKGIDQTELESTDGWWETSAGAEFGAKKLKYILGLLAQPEQEPLEYWNAVEGWVKIDEVREHFDSVGCATIYKTAGEGRVPLSLALAQPEQEPVVWTEKVGGIGFKDPMLNASYKVTATIAPQRTWVGLTDKEVEEIAVYPMNPTADLVRAIERKLKEKNT